jgi:SpoVK/Ycf46/Vps4 family AAA+-type ATPase
MSGFSSVAEIIFGHAISEAKRHDREQAEALHLLSGIRRWQEEQFDQKFPGASTSILNALERLRGDSFRTPILEDTLKQRLLSVLNTDDVWNLATALMAETEEQREPTLTSGPYMPAPSDGRLPDLSNIPVGEGDGKVIETADPLPFGVTGSLIERIAAITGKSSAETATMVLQDAAAVAVYVLGATPKDLESLIQTASGLSFEMQNPVNEISTFVREISLLPDVAAGKCATHLALALVEVGEWAASVDNEDTQSEIDRIDEIRLLFRDQLGDRIDTESAAIAAFEQKFANLIGMESVKTDLRKRLDFLVVNRRREKRGLKADVHRMHMAFLGNPGTGKTTVARLFGELLNDMGLLPTTKFIETDRSGLIGQYVGHSEIKTLKQIDAADGGVLFIDEAYALDDGYGDQLGFGHEATSVLVKQMEDRRERLVVILAGYTEPTSKYISMNPGMKSRIPTFVNFPDYSIDELRQIAVRIATNRDLVLSDGSIDRIVDAVSSEKSAEGFGNARAIENMLEGAQRNSINRTSSLGNLATEREIKTILPEDIPKVVPQAKKQFGFSPSSNNKGEE